MTFSLKSAAPYGKILCPFNRVITLFREVFLLEELEKEQERQDEGLDYDTIVEKQTDQLTELLDRRDMKELQRRMEELNEFDVAEFLSEIDDNRMPMVFRLLSKETAADVFANFDPPEQERIINAITDSELAGIIDELPKTPPAAL